MNRKRSEECLSVNHAYSTPSSTDFRKSKRFKFLSMPQNPARSALSSNSTVSRISRYPETKPSLARTLLAPCSRKFPLTSSNREYKCRTSGIFEEPGNKMGNIWVKYKKAKDSALLSCRHVEKGKEVIEVDTDSQKDAVSEDSSIEEDVEIIEDRRERHSVVTDQGRQGSAGLVIEIQDLETKVVDGGLQQQSTSSVISELTNSNLKVDNASKSLETLSISPGRDISSILAYKKLLQDADRRTDKIRRLNFEIQLREKSRLPLEYLRPEKEPEEVSAFYQAKLHII